MIKPERPSCPARLEERLFPGTEEARDRRVVLVDGQYRPRFLLPRGRAAADEEEPLGND
jgi:hypothetical protein